MVAKRLDARYRSGEREMRKVKRQRTADTVLVGDRNDFRLIAEKRRGSASSVSSSPLPKEK